MAAAVRAGVRQRKRKLIELKFAVAYAVVPTEHVHAFLPASFPRLVASMTNRHSGCSSSVLHVAHVPTSAKSKQYSNDVSGTDVTALRKTEIDVQRT